MSLTLRSTAPARPGFRLGRLALVLIAALAGGLGAEATRAQAGTVLVRGFVTDRSNGGTLPGANVSLTALDRPGAPVRGAAADADGLYQIPQVPAGRYALRVTYLGFRPYADTVALGERPNVTVNVSLEPDAERLGEVDVEAEGGAAAVEAGLQRIRPKDLGRVPTPDLSGDLASYLQALPGVVALGDRGGGLFVRGGTPSQNLALMDGLLVYQPFHIVGFFSAFPEDLVGSADFHAGGFPARFSGRVSSVLDVTMREGNFERVRAAASVSPLLLSVRAEGPLQRGGVSLIASARTSLVERAGPLIGQNLPLRFGDVFFKLTRAESAPARCSLTGLYTYDEGAVDPDATAERRGVFRWTNAALGGRCLVLPAGSPFAFEALAGVSHVRNAVGVGVAPERTSEALLVNTEVHLTRVWPRLRVGGGLFTRADFLSYTLGGQFTGIQEEDALLLSSGGYADAVFAPGAGFEVNPGVAVTAYYGDFPASVEPRLRLAWRPWGTRGPTTFSAAAGLYRQTLNGISDERDAGSLFVAWLPNPVGGRTTTAVHAIAGVQQRVGPVQLSAEGYAKRLTGLAVPIWSAVARFTTRLAPADGTVRGFDLRAEASRGPFYGLLGYGLSRTQYRLDQSGLAGRIGDPIERYHPPHDRRHQVNALVGLDVSGFETSLRWQYGSGLPFTQPYGFDTLVPLLPLPDVRDDYGVPRVLYRRPYNGRLPAYHRLDVSLERAFAVRRGTLTLQAGAVNAYDRANLFYFDVFTARRVDQLPLLPFVGAKFETR